MDRAISQTEHEVTQARPSHLVNQLHMQLHVVQKRPLASRNFIHETIALASEQCLDACCLYAKAFEGTKAPFLEACTHRYKIVASFGLSERR